MHQVIDRGETEPGSNVVLGREERGRSTLQGVHPDLVVSDRQTNEITRLRSSGFDQSALRKCLVLVVEQVDDEVIPVGFCRVNLGQWIIDLETQL